jgi:hypothetical protein
MTLYRIILLTSHLSQHHGGFESEEARRGVARGKMSRNEQQRWTVMAGMAMVLGD